MTARKHVFPAGIDLQNSELLNARLQNQFTFPDISQSDPGRIVYRSDTNLPAYFNGSEWVYLGPYQPPVTIGSPSNGLSITAGQVLSLGLASAGVTGALSGSDWSTFNGKIGGTIASGQVAFGTGTGGIGGSSDLTWNNSTKTFFIGTIGVRNTATDSLLFNTAFNAIEPGTTRNLIAGGGSSGFPNLIGFPLKPLGIGSTDPQYTNDTSYVAGFAQVATISGGYDHVNNQEAGTIVGGGHNFIKYNAQGHSFIGGGSYNIVSGGRSGIVHGRGNVITGFHSSIVGGFENRISSDYSAILNGNQNTVSGDYSTIIGGLSNNVSGQYSFSYGDTNVVSGNYAFVFGRVSRSESSYSIVFGESNQITGVSDNSAILGGFSNQATGVFSTVLAGRSNRANASYTVVGGRRSIASASGSWAISDSQDADNTNITANSFRARFSGGYTFIGGNVSIGDITASEKIDIDGNLRVRLLATAAGDFVTASATGVFSRRTASQVRTDLGVLSGTIVSNQLAFGTDANTIGGSNNLWWQNSLQRLGVGTNSPQSTIHIKSNVSGTATSVFRIDNGGTAGNEVTLELFSSATDSATSVRSGRIRSYFTGAGFTSTILSIQNVTTGNTLIDTLLLSNGSVGINGITPTNTLDVNGTARIRSIANATGNFLTVSATGVVQQRTAAEVASDIGAVTITGLSTKWVQTTTVSGGLNTQLLVPDSGSLTFTPSETVNGKKYRVVIHHYVDDPPAGNVNFDVKIGGNSFSSMTTITNGNGGSNLFEFILEFNATASEAYIWLNGINDSTAIGGLLIATYNPSINQSIEVIANTATLVQGIIYSKCEILN